MKKIKEYTPLLVLALAISCSSDSSKTTLSFKNDFEQVKGWTDYSKLSKEVANSGIYSCLTQTSDPYSSVFKLKFKDIGIGKINKVKYSVWCYASELPVKGNVVVSVRNDSIDNIFYHGDALETEISEAGRWIEISKEINLTDPLITKPNNQIGFYVWNTGTTKVYIDDMHIEFEK